MKKIYFILFSICLSIYSFAQQGLNSAASGASEAMSLKTANLSLNIDPYGVMDRDGKASSLRYTDIGGSPFLLDEWKLATIFDIGNKKIGQVKVKYNTNADQIHYLDPQEKELVADKSIIKKVVIQNDDNTTITIEKGFIGTKNNLAPYQFVEVLNDGKIQLLKQYINHVVQKDSLFGTIKVNKFSPFSIYYIKAENSVVLLKKLDQEEIFNLLPNKEFISNYTSKNKKLRSEKDFINFINNYNKL